MICKGYNNEWHGVRACDERERWELIRRRQAKLKFSPSHLGRGCRRERFLPARATAQCLRPTRLVRERSRVSVASLVEWMSPILAAFPVCRAWRGWCEYHPPSCVGGHGDCLWGWSYGGHSQAGEILVALAQSVICSDTHRELLHSIGKTIRTFFECVNKWIAQHKRELTSGSFNSTLFFLLLHGMCRRRQEKHPADIMIVHN